MKKRKKSKTWACKHLDDEWKRCAVNHSMGEYAHCLWHTNIVEACSKASDLAEHFKGVCKKTYALRLHVPVLLQPEESKPDGEVHGTIEDTTSKSFSFRSS